MKWYDENLDMNTANVNKKWFYLDLQALYRKYILGQLGGGGEKGEKGDTGDTGPQGIQGEKGDTGDTGPQGIQGEIGPRGDEGNFTIFVQALTHTPVNYQTVYFGMIPSAPMTNSNINKIYIRKSGKIKIAEIYCYSGTAGTGEEWSLYIRKNNTTDYLIGTVSLASNERVFSNVNLSIDVQVNDYIEIKSVQPAWVTRPATTKYGGYIYIE